MDRKKAKACPRSRRGRMPSTGLRHSLETPQNTSGRKVATKEPCFPNDTGYHSLVGGSEWSSIGRGDAKPEIAPTTHSRYELILRPGSSPISQDQLAAEVKGIYAGLVMVEAKCINIDAAQAADPSSTLGPEQWQALIALHRTLLYEHHDFLMATQHPSATQALRGLATKYSMPARMWRHGIHAFLEVLRHRRPDSQDYMLAFIYLAYQMMALLFETVPTFTDTWIECLGDLARYRMAIEDEREAHAIWAGVAARWYKTSSDRHPAIGRLSHHLGILEPTSLKKVFLYMKAETCVIPFPNARDSLATLCAPITEERVHPPCKTTHSAEASLVTFHALAFPTSKQDITATLASTTLSQLNRLPASKIKNLGVPLVVTNVAAMLEYGSSTNLLRQLFDKANYESPKRPVQNSSPNVAFDSSMSNRASLDAAIRHLEDREQTESPLKTRHALRELSDRDIRPKPHCSGHPRSSSYCHLQSEMLRSPTVYQQIHDQQAGVRPSPTTAASSDLATDCRDFPFTAASASSLLVDFCYKSFNVFIRHQADDQYLRDILPSVHVALVWLHSLNSLQPRHHRNTAGSPVDPEQFSWNGFSEHLKTLVHTDSEDSRTSERAPPGSFPAVFEAREEYRPLPEDFFIRGLIWNKSLFPPDWFSGSDVLKKTDRSTIPREKCEPLAQQYPSRWKRSLSRTLKTLSGCANGAAFVYLLKCLPSAAAEGDAVSDSHTASAGDLVQKALSDVWCVVNPLLPFVPIGVGVVRVANAIRSRRERLAQPLYTRNLGFAAASFTGAMGQLYDDFDHAKIVATLSWASFFLETLVISLRMVREDRKGHFTTGTTLGTIVSSFLVAWYISPESAESTDNGQLRQVVRLALDVAPFMAMASVWALYETWKAEPQSGTILPIHNPPAAISQAST